MNENTWQEVKRIFHEAVELDENLWRDFLAANCADEEVCREIEELLAFHQKENAFIDNPAIVEAGRLTAEDDFTGRKIGRYEIVREIGRGGMGVVYEAVRYDDFTQKAALKIIKRGMDTDFILRRFQNERQILASLNHPHIAGLLDGGTTGEGLPYFVMEYIEGRPLLEYCASHELNIEERLKLFQKICSAVAYAHQNLVVHRDLKPSNILVTADGNPKLLDFGIAKIIISGDEAATAVTDGFTRLFTPEYASPEQIRGERITTSSDVYSLGVILYELLSGQNPFRRKNLAPHEWMQAICETFPAKPSEAVTRRRTARETRGEKTARPSAIRSPQLKGDLDNIIFKAIQKEPSRRYLNVPELSEDIRRHLAGLPVSARADTFGYRASKFVKRHRFGVFAAALLFLSLLGGISATVWQAGVARNERDKARQRFNEVRKLANSLLFEYHDGIEKLPGSTPIREKMVKDALAYLDNLAKESLDDLTLRREVAAAYFKVGDVQGAPYRANLGDSRGALESHRKALAIRERLNLGDSTAKFELAQSYSAVGELLHITGETASALEHYQKAFAIFDSTAGENAAAARELSILQVRYGKALVSSGKLTEGLEIYRKAVEGFRQLISAEPDDRRLQHDLAFAYIFRGDALEEQGDLRDALESQRTAYALLEPLARPTDAQSRRAANVAYGRIADVLFKLGDKKEALEIQTKGLKIDEEIAKADPLNALLQRDLYIDYYKIAYTLEKTGNSAEALKNQKICVELVETAAQANPLNAETKGDLSTAYFRYGEMLETAKKFSGALDNYKKAAAVEEEMTKADPQNAVARSSLSESYMTVSNLYLRLGQFSEAFAGYQKALALRENLLKENPDSAESRIGLARIYESLGDYFVTSAAREKRRENLSQAKQWFESSLNVWAELEQQNKLRAEYKDKAKEIARKIAKCETEISSGA